MTFPSTLRLKQQQEESEQEIQPQKKLPSTLKLKQEQPSSVSDNLKEIPSELAKGTVSGLFGSYGNILDILGLQSKETLPAEKAKRSREFDILEKMRSGERPSFSDLMELSDDDIAPRYSRLPTTQDINEIFSKIGLSEPKTVAGRYAKRGGEFLGAGLSFGQANIPLALSAGAAGQTLEETGAPPWAQAIGEIATAMKMSRVKTPISSSSPVVQKQLDNLKNLGFSDKDVTIARNALEDRGFLKKSAKYTREAENRFKETQKNIQGNVEKIVEDSFPGLREGGPEAFKNAAVELYDSLDNFAREVKITKPFAFSEAADKAIEEMERSLAKSGPKQEAINILKNAKEQSFELPTPADFYTNFYKELNAIGNWGNPKQRESAFGIVKNAVKETFKKQGPEGVKLANSLEEANKSWMKYLNAEDVSNLIGKASTEEGINFKKLHNLLQKSDNKDIFIKGLGEKQTENLIKLSEISSQIGDFEKAVKGGIAKDILSQGTLYGMSKAILSGDLSALKTMGGVQIAGTLATKLLTDPKYQNLAIKMAESAKDQRWNTVQSISRAIEHKLRQDSKLKPSKEGRFQE